MEIILTSKVINFVENRPSKKIFRISFIIGVILIIITSFFFDYYIKDTVSSLYWKIISLVFLLLIRNIVYSYLIDKRRKEQEIEIKEFFYDYYEELLLEKEYYKRRVSEIFKEDPSLSPNPKNLDEVNLFNLIKKIKIINNLQDEYCLGG